MRWHHPITFTIAIALSSICWPAWSADFVQQGAKLVGTGAIGGAQQGLRVCFSADGNTAIVAGAIETWVWTRSGSGWIQQAKLSGGGSVALSGDGNTAIIGAPSDGASIWIRAGETWLQQGPRLLASDALGNSEQGVSVSLSADGNTALIGGDRDNYVTGAAWVWTRTAGLWQQQSKLVASEGGNAQQGFSVCLSADGNTAAVGGPNDDNQTGAAWIWIRTGATWIKQFKLLASGTGRAYQGYSVSLSTDGDTAVVGAPATNSGTGAAWVWTRAQGAWTQQGGALVSADPTGAANQGNSVSLAADGNILLVGGSGDAAGIGAAWVWTRITGIWVQEGNKLVGSGATRNAGQGFSVALSGDGSTSIIGGPFDNVAVVGSGNGAAWIWKRTDHVWAQQGNKLVGSSAAGRAAQGWSVSLSADGSTAIVGGPDDNNLNGAAWVWIRNGGIWSQESKLVDVNGYVQQGYSVSISADGNTAIVGASGAPSIWTKIRGTWTLQQSNLVGSGAVGFASQGIAVAISADGNTVIVGGYSDGGGTETNGLYYGAAWVWTRKGGVWTQQGPKLVASDAVNGKYGSYQGAAVALSADGNTAIIGGPEDDTQIGAAWIWTRSGETWTQQGPKLVGSPVPGLPAQGNAVALSADGNTAIIGAADRTAGAWVWTRNAGVWTEQVRLVTSAQSEGGFAGQGNSLSISADGNTIIVGGFPYQDRSASAKAWTKNARGAWDEQRLLVSAPAGTTDQVFAVAISADGRTAILGGGKDNSGVGAAWVFQLPSPPRRRAARH